MHKSANAVLVRLNRQNYLTDRRAPVARKAEASSNQNYQEFYRTSSVTWGPVHPNTVAIGASIDNAVAESNHIRKGQATHEQIGMLLEIDTELIGYPELWEVHTAADRCHEQVRARRERPSTEEDERGVAAPRACPAILQHV